MALLEVKNLTKNFGGLTAEIGRASCRERVFGYV